MTTPTLDPRARELFSFLHRGGTKSYLWAVRGKHEKTSLWWDTGGTPAALLNSQHNMYFGVHPCTAIPTTNSKGKQVRPEHVRSQLAYIAAINCLFGEFDAKKFISVTDDEARTEQQSSGGTLEEARSRIQERIFLTDPEHYKALALAHINSLSPRPSIIIDSGGGYHVYWLFRVPYLITDDESRRRAKYAQYAWVDYVESDDDAKDLARVLRVPGTQNFKPGYAPNYPTVHFTHAEFERLYTFEELEALLPPEQIKTAKVRTPQQIIDARINQNEIGSSPDFDAIAQAAMNLKRLSPERRDTYRPWVNVGMALAELGAIGYNLWELWSKSSPKYNVGDCADKWQTFRPASGADDLSLGSLARWANDDDPNGRPDPSPEVEQLQRENDDYRKREEWQAKILARKDIKLNEKAVMIGIEPILSLRRNLGCHKEDHTGSVPAAYKRLGELVATSPSTIGKVIDLGEKIDLWRRDPEVKQSKDGYDIQIMRLDLQPAFDNPDLGQLVERKQHGGARPNAGRKPKCPKCPPDTAVVVRAVKRIETQCLGCGDILHIETIPLSAEVIGAEIQDKIGNDAPVSAELVFQDEIETAQVDADGIQDETEVVPLFTSVSSLPVAVPIILEETFDLITAIRLADTFSPADECGRMAYKTALSWLYRSEPQKALGRVGDIPDPPARAIIEHLAARAIYAQAVTS